MWSALPDVLLGSTLPVTVMVAAAPLNRFAEIAEPVPLWVPALSCTDQIAPVTLAGSRSLTVIWPSSFGPLLVKM